MYWSPFGVFIIRFEHIGYTYLVVLLLLRECFQEVKIMY